MRCIVLALCWFCVQCSSVPQKLWAPVEQPPLLEKAVFLKSQKKWDQAEVEVRNYLVQTQDIYWQGAALLLLGEILEKRQQVSEAQETYNKLLNHAGYDSYHVGRALYSLSWIDESQQDCQNLIVHLTDLQKMPLKGDDFIKNVELPARLSNCYYWMNQWEAAQTLRTKALNNKSQYKAEDLPADVWWRTHLYLGYVGVLTTEKIDRRYSEIIPLGQKELFLLIEQGPAPFNTMAQERLMSLYESYFLDMTQKPLAKTAVEKNAINTTMLRELSLLVDLIEELKSYKSPEGLTANSTESFLSKIEAIRQKARTLAQRLELGIQKEQKRRGAR